MSHQDWQGPLFDPPQVRREAAQRIKVEHPPGIEIRQVVAPPAPDEHLAAELWRQADAAEAAEPPPDGVQTIAGLSLALYLLHSLHAPDKPGYEHLVREEQKDDEDDPDAERR